MDYHEPACSTWDWMNGERTTNNARPCTCGLRAKQAKERDGLLARHRPLKPLGMSDEDFLRTLGISPTTAGTL